jgi:hypothetical protein
LLNFDDTKYTSCDDDGQTNQDFATFFGKTIKYKKESETYLDFTIWTNKDETIPTEHEFKDNIDKMVNKFIKYENENGLYFLE